MCVRFLCMWHFAFHIVGDEEALWLCRIFTAGFSYLRLQFSQLIGSRSGHQGGGHRFFFARISRRRFTPVPQQRRGKAISWSFYASRPRHSFVGVSYQVGALSFIRNSLRFQFHNFWDDESESGKLPPLLSCYLFLVFELQRYLGRRFFYSLKEKCTILAKANNILQWFVLSRPFYHQKNFLVFLCAAVGSFSSKKQKALLSDALWKNYW